MRNIKTTLRYARNSALLLSAMAGAVYMASCSNESDLNSGQEDITEPAMGTGIYSVYGSNPNRVHNYGDASTRAAGENTLAASFTMDEFKTTPTDANEMVDGVQWGLSGNYVVKGETTRYGIGFNGDTDIYVEGKFHVNNIALNDASIKVNIYVQENGVFDFMGGTLNSGVNIYSKGDLVFSQGTIIGKTNIKTENDITCSGELSVNDGAEVYTRGSILCDNTVRINGKIVACAITAENTITFNDNGTVQTTYIEAPTIVMNGGNVVLENNGLAWAKNELNPTNTDSHLTATAGSKALVYAENVKTSDSTMGSHIPDIFYDANVWVVYKAFNLTNDVIEDIKDQTASHIYHVSQVTEGKDAYGKDIVVSSNGTCHKSFGFTGDPEKPFGELEDDPTPEDPEVELIPVADIENPDVEDPFKHDHGEISATCISFGGNGVAYASFHRRGTENSDYNQGYVDNKGHKGCIEKIVYEGGKFALRTFMIAPEWDFNHIYADVNANRVITVGNHVKKGAFIAALPVNFEASEGVSEEFAYKELTTDEVLYGPSKNDPNKQIKLGYQNAGDGNCVVRVGDLYYVTTFSGYGALDLNFKKAGKFTATSGSSKHIALDGSGKMSIISLDEYNKTKNESPATIKEFAETDKDFGSAKKDYKAGANVAPIDGKNTIAYSGSDLFACLGHGGLTKNGQSFYQRNNVPVNGVTVVGKYIFVANGSFLDVLDLSGKRLCHYHDKNLHSSNFVAVDNKGFIYVAFGKSDIKIFKLGGTAVSSDWYIAGK